MNVSLNGKRLDCTNNSSYSDQQVMDQLLETKIVTKNLKNKNFSTKFCIEYNKHDVLHNPSTFSKTVLTYYFYF